jgi:hypothetical protein
VIQEHQAGPSTSNLVQPEEEEVAEQRNSSIDEPEVDSSERLDNTVLIKSAVIGKDDKDKRKRRRELMDYDDRQRTIKLINNFSEEQINSQKTGTCFWKSSSRKKEKEDEAFLSLNFYCHLIEMYIRSI